MAKRPRALLHFSALAALVALAACGPSEESELANLDNQITGNDADPALTSALEDQILVDPALTQQSNRNAVRPAESPTQGQYPVGSGRAARTPVTVQAAKDSMAAARDGQGAACGAQFDYDLAWARRLPVAFAVYPGGRLTEAAGNNQGDCAVRVVTFTSRDAQDKVIGWYHDAAVRAGYSSEQQQRGGDRVLGGANQQDGGAFYLIVTPLPRGGSDVALIANNGR